MAFTSGIPSTGQKLGASRQQVQDNFSYCANTLAIDHYPINNANAGKHQHVTMPAASDPVTGAGECALFGKTVDGNVQVFWRMPSSFASVQITGSQINTSTNGAIPLMGGLLLQWGTTGASTGNINVVMPIGFTTGGVASSPFNIQLTPLRATASPGSAFGFWVSTTGISTTTFTIVNNSGHSFAFYWTAIGLRT